jgi:hypothetical protein
MRQHIHKFLLVLLGLIYLLFTLMATACHRKQVQSHTDSVTVLKQIPIIITEQKATQIISPNALYNLPIGKHIDFVDSTNSVKGEVFRDSAHYYFTATRIAQKDTVVIPLKEYHHYHTETKTVHQMPWYGWLIIVLGIIALIVATLKR